jgi:hypothetical protein
MATKAEMEARWADLSQRLGNDPKLAEVIDRLDKVLDDIVPGEKRERLKVPYANATSLDDGSRWN